MLIERIKDLGEWVDEGRGSDGYRYTNHRLSIFVALVTAGTTLLVALMVMGAIFFNSAATWGYCYLVEPESAYCSAPVDYDND